jgi:hypothetical protein
MKYDIPYRDRQGIVVETESPASHPASLPEPSYKAVSRYRLWYDVFRQYHHTSPKRQRYYLGQVCEDVVPEVFVLIQTC